jgi:hypothetical protein
MSRPKRNRGDQSASLSGTATGKKFMIGFTMFDDAAKLAAFCVTWVAWQFGLNRCLNCHHF